MFEIEWLVVFLLLGAVIGLVAGLLGVGGGGIMVPALSAIFLYQGMSPDNVIHLALATSMASIIITSLISLRVHHAKAGVLWNIVKGMSPGLLIGTFTGTLIASHIEGVYLAVFFAIFMAIVSLQILLNKPPRESRAEFKRFELGLVGIAIGGLSALVSIGGGSLTVPYLMRRNIEITKAIGTSAAIGLPISLAGTMGYLINGWGRAEGVAYSLGYVYLPAVLLISVASAITVPFGVKMAHYLPIAVLKKIFAVLLMIISLKMVVSII